MKIERKINIGITVALKDFNDSFFTNGIKQNVFILRDLYEKCRNVKNAYIISVTGVPSDSQKINEQMKPYLKHFISIDQAFEKCDLVVIAQGFLSREVCKLFKQKGKKLTKHIMGPELSTFNETILFKDNKDARNVYVRNKGTISNVWISPHYYERDKCLFETAYDTDVVIAPYVWDPRFINHHVDELLKQDNNIYTGKYIPSGKKSKRICSMEPNVNVVKTSLVPIMINEHLYRKNPSLIEKSYLFASDKIKTKTDLVNFVKDLDVYKGKKMFFENRFPIVWTLQGYTDIVLGHQNQNELNYLYLDASWLGYPVVHNSPMMKELGWYYEENNIKQAVEHLAYVAEYFDDNEYQNDEYMKKSRTFAYRYMIDNPENIRGYERLIEIAMDSKI